MKDKLEIEIKIKTDGSVGSFATVLQTLFFVSCVMLDYDFETGKQKTYRPRDYTQLKHTGTEFVRIKTKEVA